MKLELLYKRESFREIFNDAVGQFFAFYYKLDIEISWSKSRFTSSQKVFCVNSKLNVIYPYNLNKNILYNLCKEYAYNKNVLRRALQFIYVYAFTKTFLRKLVVEKVQFSEYLSVFDNLVFLPGNNVIRVLDYNSKTSFVINKLKTNHEFFNKGNQIRNDLNIRSAPKIILLSKNFMQEELISGTPINRIANKDLIDSVLNSVHKELNVIYSNSLELFTINTYEILINSKTSVLKDKSSLLKNTINVLFKSLKSQIGSNSLIPISYTHGDFQKANILVTQQRYLIIDWEFVDKRFLYYDFFTELFGTRSSNNYFDNIRKWREIKSNNFSFSNWANDGMNFSIDQNANIYVIIFLIEELLFRASEITLTNSKNNQVFDMLVSDINKNQFYEK